MASHFFVDIVRCEELGDCSRLIELIPIKAPNIRPSDIKERKSSHKLPLLIGNVLRNVLRECSSGMFFGNVLRGCSSGMPPRRFFGGDVTGGLSGVGDDVARKRPFLLLRRASQTRQDARRNPDMLWE